MSIFVAIAAYRDPELSATLADCRATARWPGELRYGVCRQYDADEPALDGFYDLPGLRVIDVPAHSSGGACWARARTMALYDAEDFYLQLDSHHRFARHWDAILLDQFERCASDRALLSTYAPGYDPAGHRDPPAPTAMRVDRFTTQGIPLFRSREIPVGGPRRARFVSGHLLFAPGRFVAEIPYDDQLYFIGEEISLAVRAFTHGYDLFHPGEHVLWHHYGRAAAPKHWHDHVLARDGAPSWHTRDIASFARSTRMLAGEAIGPCGLGTIRSLDDYQRYAGIDFRQRHAIPAARRGDEPAPFRVASPSPLARVRIAIERERLDPAAGGGRFWYVGFHDAAGRELLRVDADRHEIMRTLDGNRPILMLERHIPASTAVASWTLWPTDRRGRWLDPIRSPATMETIP